MFLLWAALLAVVGLGSLADTFAELLRIVLAVDFAVLVVLVIISLWALRHPPHPSVGGSVPAAPGADGDVQGHGQLRG